MLNKLLQLFKRKPNLIEINNKLRIAISERLTYAGLDVNLIPDEWLAKVLHASEGSVMAVGVDSIVSCNLAYSVVCGNVEFSPNKEEFNIFELKMKRHSFAVLLDEDHPRKPVFVYA